MQNKNSIWEINFLIKKAYVHKWPINSILWTKSFADEIDLHLNKNKEKMRVCIKDSTIQIDNFHFHKIKKIGVSIPLFKKEMTMVFEGKIKEFCVHVHITTGVKNYLEIFNNIMDWKNNLFPD